MIFVKIFQLNAILGTNADPVFARPRKGDVKHSMADISKAEEKLGYSAEYDFTAGLIKAVKFYCRSS